MSDLTPILIAFFACIPPTLVALAALISSRRNTKKADETLKKSDVIIAKAEEIHTSTNGSLTKANEALAVAMDKIINLEKLITAMGAPAKDKPAKK